MGTISLPLDLLTLNFNNFLDYDIAKNNKIQTPTTM